ncbi:MAG: YajQ family cyclic di-GMP-binding protein [Gammaproteobacteria bacterium]|jgi:hypothetical protein|nr:YajQ family cyclic di-GMP-binding protein [Gammaproteobacteria bacterium]
MPSFDIVSEVDSAELLNASQNTEREITNRYDFRNVDTEIKFANDIITLQAESDFQVQQLLDVLRAQLVKRKVDPLTMDFNNEPTHRGKAFFVEVRFKQGIDKDLARKITKLIKDSKMKVQAQIQGDQVRVTGKKRDDLQAAMQLLRESNLEQPIQFKNFRD